MNTKEIVEQIGVTMDNVYACYERDIERFAELVRQDEREACAKLCEKFISNFDDGVFFAEIIRARVENERS